MTHTSLLPCLSIEHPSFFLTSYPVQCQGLYATQGKNREVQFTHSISGANEQRRPRLLSSLWFGEYKVLRCLSAELSSPLSSPAKLHTVEHIHATPRHVFALIPTETLPNNIWKPWRFPYGCQQVYVWASLTWTCWCCRQCEEEVISFFFSLPNVQKQASRHQTNMQTFNVPSRDPFSLIFLRLHVMCEHADSCPVFNLYEANSASLDLSNKKPYTLVHLQMLLYRTHKSMFPTLKAPPWKEQRSLSDCRCLCAVQGHTLAQQKQLLCIWKWFGCIF